MVSRPELAQDPLATGWYLSCRATAASALVLTFVCTRWSTPTSSCQYHVLGIHRYTCLYRLLELRATRAGWGESCRQSKHWQDYLTANDHLDHSLARWKRTSVRWQFSATHWEILKETVDRSLPRLSNSSQPHDKSYEVITDEREKLTIYNSLV